ncbi:hypothetical protein O3P69_003285 [Scylla paramamosain]
MWMRGRDLHILTVGKVTYSADERFQIMHSHETDDWTLQIQYTQPRDAGAYKCQVNSDPKIVRNVYLTVTDKRFLDGQLYKMPPSTREQGEYGTHIVGGGTRFLQAGSSLALECVVTHTRAPPSAVLWYRDNNLLDYDSPRGGISLQVEKAGTADHLQAASLCGAGDRFRKLHVRARQCSRQRAYSLRHRPRQHRGRVAGGRTARRAERGAVFTLWP